MSTKESAQWDDCMRVVKADLRVDVSKSTTTSSAVRENFGRDEPTSDERHRLMESGGALDFWNDPSEDIYSLDDGDPV